MKCPRCGGRIVKQYDEIGCVNCGKEIQTSDNIYQIAVNSLVVQKVLRKVWF